MSASTQAVVEESHQRRVDPFLMSVLKSRFEAIVREMSLVVKRSSRSAVIKNANDFSCAILTFDHRLVTTEDALPIHVVSMDMATKHLTVLFDDIAKGDAFLNNCPYTGGTHHADMILAMPVFFNERPLFWVVALAHHADTGAPVPSTYLPFAKNVYEEGMHFPCVRILQDYKERTDVLRIGQVKIRASDIWIGDLRAQIGACKTGERRLTELITRYGLETVEAFVEDWFDYGSRRAAAEIKKLPKGRYTYEIRHDPVPGVAEEGIPVKVVVEVDSDEGYVTVDLRDNVDSVPGGLNLSENTSTSSARIGVFNNLDASIPHNQGSASRIKVLLREGGVVGKPAYPTGTSVATTNVNDRLIMAGNCAFSKMGAPYGHAESGPHLPLGMAVISGKDPYKGGKVYVNQLFVGYSGGGANYGHDGWLTYCGAANGGLITLDSIEVDESMYPIVLESREIQPDTQGFGEFEGAPGVGGAYYPLDHDMTAVYAADATLNPPKGVLGGTEARPTYSRKMSQDGSVGDLPSFNEEVCKKTEKFVYFACGGGGYGEPSKRDPQRVVASLNRGWLTAKTAERVYRVVARYDEARAEYALDEAATVKLRAA